jgi:transposase, IS30 family
VQVSTTRAHARPLQGHKPAASLDLGEHVPAAVGVELDRGVDATAGEQPHQLAELVHGEVRSADVHAHQAPSTWSDHIYGYLPVPAGVAVTSVRPDPTSLGAVDRVRRLLPLRGRPACAGGLAPAPQRRLSRAAPRGRCRYRAQAADAAAFRRAQRPKPAKLVTEPRLRALVEAKLALRWSPEQIAGWLPLAYPGDAVMRVSHETIYLSLFVQSRGALRRELQRCLRTGRAMRYPRAKWLPQGRGQLRDTLHISQRPPEAADRAVPGHWEGDLVLGKRPSAVGILVERHSRYVMLFPLPDGFTAERMRPALTSVVLRLPQQLRRSLTWDHGKEMAEHPQFTIDSGVQVYFCDPRSPWQRGTNENTNGLLRQYLANGADLRQFDQAALDAIAAELNGRPRQTLGFKTPSQALAEALR